MRMVHRYALCAGLLLLPACESDAAKLQRLKTNEAIASLDLLSFERDRDSIAAELVDSLVAAGKLQRWVKTANSEDKLLFVSDPELWGGSPFAPKLRPVMDSIYAARNRLQLAERDMNAFMGGR